MTAKPLTRQGSISCPVAIHVCCLKGGRRQGPDNYILSWPLYDLLFSEYKVVYQSELEKCTIIMKDKASAVQGLEEGPALCPPQSLNHLLQQVDESCQGLGISRCLKMIKSKNLQNMIIFD